VWGRKKQENKQNRGVKNQRTRTNKPKWWGGKKKTKIRVSLDGIEFVYTCQIQLASLNGNQNEFDCH